MTTFELMICCDTAAFQHTQDRVPKPSLPFEIVRILREVANRIEDDAGRGLITNIVVCRDVHGNRVGTAVLLQDQSEGV